MQTDDPDAMLAQLLDSDLSELLSISYVVLANNQVTNRHIERVHDMPVQCWSALLATVSFPGTRARDLLHLFPRPQNTVSRALALLEGRGLIEQRPCPQDARAKRLYPTPDGSDLLATIRQTARLRQDEMFGVLDPRERATLLALCRKIAAGPRLVTSQVMPDQARRTGMPLDAGVSDARSPRDSGDSGFSSGK
ncbi:MarR family winged helix-turn-helix transcriptional regulator [Paracoccus marcusii]|uniref:MarR family winged helix-turn-helix transcriptional regulator n=1 Tax=Paracoccus marcusii TaxID=59779 RepID=UPI002ED55333|nr:MarR family winged helix-turn-helix transcriptional regulator [Paracoccus marcusii]